MSRTREQHLARMEARAHELRQAIDLSLAQATEAAKHPRWTARADQCTERTKQQLDAASNAFTDMKAAFYDLEDTAE